jgi:hypothetical protein
MTLPILKDERFRSPECKCGEKACDEHQCPFQNDVHNDPDYLCNCCEACTEQCADDI